jgi:hypothetical protein
MGGDDLVGCEPVQIGKGIVQSVFLISKPIKTDHKDIFTELSILILSIMGTA